MKNFIAFLFMTIFFPLYGQSILGEGINGIGVRGTSTHGAGVFGSSANNSGVAGISTSGSGVFGVSTNDFGVIGQSENGTGGSFRGGGGIAIELRGADSPWGEDFDDCVIHTDLAQEGGDMILITNDNFTIHMDEDANSTSEFAIHNGINTKIWSINEAGTVSALGAINGSSDLNRKENIISIESGKILRKVADLPISQWQFKGEKIRHIGPMAQDFYTAFGLGEGETTIATVDADGVALAAIQALKVENDLLKEQVLALQNQMTQLMARGKRGKK